MSGKIQRRVKRSGRFVSINERVDDIPYRYYDTLLGVIVVQILPGDCYVTNTDEVLSTVLGSCVTVCLQDCSTQTGGMNHFVLPDSDSKMALREGRNRYGQNAMESLLSDVLQLGADRCNLQAKIFGGGSLIDSEQDVGKRNATFAEKYLEIKNISVVGRDYGLSYSRKIRFSPVSGRVQIKRVPTRHQ